MCDRTGASTAEEQLEAARYREFGATAYQIDFEDIPSLE